MKIMSTNYNQTPQMTKPNIKQNTQLAFGSAEIILDKAIFKSANESGEKIQKLIKDLLEDNFFQKHFRKYFPDTPIQKAIKKAPEGTVIDVKKGTEPGKVFIGIRTEESSKPKQCYVIEGKPTGYVKKKENISTISGGYAQYFVINIMNPFGKNKDSVKNFLTIALNQITKKTNISKAKIQSKSIEKMAEKSGL